MPPSPPHCSTLGLFNRSPRPEVSLAHEWRPAVPRRASRRWAKGNAGKGSAAAEGGGRSSAAGGRPKADKKTRPGYERDDFVVGSDEDEGDESDDDYDSDEDGSESGSDEEAEEAEEEERRARSVGPVPGSAGARMPVGVGVHLGMRAVRTLHTACP